MCLQSSAVGTRPDARPGRRFRAPGAALVATLSLLPGSLPALVISEVMYHPRDAGQQQLEFIELYNENADPLDLSGFTLCNGVDFTFPPGTFLDGRSFLVVCADEQAIRATYGITNAIGDWDGALSNGGERIEICNAGGVTLVEVDYDDRGKWPVGADGAGHSLSLVDPFVEIDDPDSWVLSETFGGTPGAPNNAAFEEGAPTAGAGSGMDASGFILKWLVLGPYLGSSCNLGDRLTRDWLLGNFVAETDLIWEDGQEVATNYSLAESTGLHRNSGVSRPRISEYTSPSDTINFNDAVWPPDPDNVMAYAFCYVDNVTGRRLPADIACASDDAIAILLNGEPVHANDACRGVGGSGEIQDRASVVLDEGKNLLVVKVFENGGGWSFRLRFEESPGTPIVSNARIQVTTDHTKGMEFGGGGEPIEPPDEPPPAPPEGPGTPAAAFPVVINEALLRTAETRWVELYNTSGQTIDLAGLHLTDDTADLTRYRLPAGTVIAPHGHLVLTEGETGLDFSGGQVGENVFIALVSPEGDRVYDAYNFRPDYDGLSEARLPDGDREFDDATEPTRGAPNRRTATDDVVINEVMYHPIDEDSDREYVELYNRGAIDIDMTGWRFSRGIEFDIPPGTVIRAGDYLVVARDPDLLRSIYDLGDEVIGPGDEESRDVFGRLRDRGERLTLQDALGRTVDTVRYHDGGEWPRWADGHGSSLELIDPFADNRAGQAWDASDDSDKAETTEFRYVGRHGGGESELHVLLLDRGITIVDDISVVGGGVQTDDTPLVEAGDVWSYFKGTRNPPSAWTDIEFDDGAWPRGATGIGYGDGDDVTVLGDMRGSYLTIFCRRLFEVSDPDAIDELVLSAVIDDGFYAYLNGTLVASANVTGTDFDSPASTAGEPELIETDISRFKNLLRAGTNVLAIQVHNANLTSSDLSFEPRLLDRTTVVTGGSEQIVNGTFDSTDSGWIIEGTHIRSGRTTARPIRGAGSLKIIASGRGDNKVNRIETSNTGIGSLRTNEELEISLKARWVIGSRTLLTHGYEHAMARTHELSVPENLGSPGAVNSVTLRQIGRTGSRDLGPTISRVVQDPPIPGSGESVSVRAKVRAPGGIDRVTLRYSTTGNPSASPTSRVMRLVENDVYEGTIPGQSTGTTVVFYITATDTRGREGRYPVDVTERTHPLLLDPSSAGAADQRYLVYRHDQKSIETVYHGYRFFMTSSDEAYLDSRRNLSNELISGSFLYGSRRLYYESKTRFSGSPFARGRWGSFRVVMPRDDLLHGRIRKMNLDSHHGDGRDARERISHYLIRQQQSATTAVPYSEVQTLARWKVNGRGSSVLEHTWVPDVRYLDLWFPGDSDGDFFEIDDRFVINDSGGLVSNTNARLLYPPPSSRSDGDGGNKENYRWFFGLRARNGADDYDSLIEFARVMDPGVTSTSSFDRQIRDMANVEEMLRMWAVRLNTDDWDHWGANRGKNAYLYRPGEDGRWHVLAWDMELTYGNTGSFNIPSSPSNALSPGGFAEVNRFLDHFKRLYYGILAEMVEGENAWFGSDYVSPYVEKLQAFGMSQTQIGMPGGFIDQRADIIRSRIRSVVYPQVRLAITTRGGRDFMTDGATVSLQGTAPVDVQMILVNGELYEASFSGMTDWEVDEIPLHGGANDLAVLGLTLKGDLVDSDSITVTTTADWDPPALTSIAPAVAAAGETIELRGHDFHDGLRVFFAERESPGVAYDEHGARPDRILAQVSDGLIGAVEVTVRNADGQTSNSLELTVLPPPAAFVRGDSNGDGRVDVTDAVRTLRHLYAGVAIPCDDAADTNDDERLDLTDATCILAYLFQGGPTIPAPFPGAGPDPGGDRLGCER